MDACEVIEAKAHYAWVDNGHKVFSVRVHNLEHQHERLSEDNVGTPVHKDEVLEFSKPPNGAVIDLDGWIKEVYIANKPRDEWYAVRRAVSDDYEHYPYIVSEKTTI